MGHRWLGVLTLILTTTGRRSSQLRWTPFIFGQDGVVDRHPRQGTHVWIESVAKQLDTVAAIGDLYRFDRFPPPDEISCCTGE